MYVCDTVLLLLLRLRLIPDGFITIRRTTCIFMYIKRFLPGDEISLMGLIVALFYNFIIRYCLILLIYNIEYIAIHIDLLYKYHFIVGCIVRSIHTGGAA